MEFLWKAMGCFSDFFFVDMYGMLIESNAEQIHVGS